MTSILNATHIRIIALLTMIIDHIGLFLLPDVFLLRIIGRFSFPLFAWLIANGATHTSDIRKYTLRIGVMAAVSQVPYSILFGPINAERYGWNIFMTLFIGLLVIVAFKKWENKIVRLIAIFAGSLFAAWVNSSYGAAGVLAIVICYVFRNNPVQATFFLLFNFAMFYIAPDAFRALISQQSTLMIHPLYLYQPSGALALLLTMFYNNQNGKYSKFITYSIYPLHLVALSIILKLMH